MNRRFLYMMVEAGVSSCTLRRTNPSRLFYPKDSPERAVAAAAAATMEAAAAARVVEDARLPPPTTTIHYNSGGMTHFALLGRDKDKILTFDGPSHYDTFGRAVLYDDGSRTFHVLPSPRRLKINPFWVAVGDGVYSVDDVRQPDGSRRMTGRHGDDDDRYATTVDALVPRCHEDDDYSWRDVSPPPNERMEWKSELSAYAAVGGSSIWMSTGCRGTLALDTASGAWSKAGDWPLPFVGRAAEQGGLWFGFSAGDTHLEAWDLRADGGPTSRLRWGDMPGIVGGSAFESEVAVLGDGRLCVGRLFEVHPPPPKPSRRRYYSRRRPMRPRERKRPPRVFAMLTGVEVVDDGDGDGGGLRLIEHKTCRYSLGECKFGYLRGRRKFVQLLF